MQPPQVAFFYCILSGGVYHIRDGAMASADALVFAWQPLL
jgi:hypothetical protein